VYKEREYIKRESKERKRLFFDDYVCVKVRNGTLIIFHFIKFYYFVIMFSRIRFLVVLFTLNLVLKKYF
jgi:hypothetical protein